MAILGIKFVRSEVMLNVYSWSRGINPASLELSPLAKTEAENRILKVINEIKKGPDMEEADIDLGRLLRILVESVNAKHVVEIGTSRGYSSLWICLGLLTTNGKLTTHEIDPQRVVLAKEIFQRAGVENMVTVVEGDAHKRINGLTEPIDILFIDAEKSGYADYLEKLLPLVRPGGLILADNAHKPGHFPEFIEAITTNPDLETVGLNMYTSGISLSLKKRGGH
jgi:predicted O-methyltransferase YrrM